MADILAYWHAVELFDPHDIPQARRRDILDRKPGSRCVEVIGLTAGEPLPSLPWQPGHPRNGELPEASKYGSTWRHTVYGGVFSFHVVRAALAQVIGYTEEDDYAGTQDSDSALFALTVNENGILVEGTAVFSTCAWATGRLYRPGPAMDGWLDGFDEVMGECEHALYRLLSKPVSYLPTPSGATPRETQDWRVSVTDVLGGAAAGAVTALIGTVAPVVGGAAGAGALAGAAGSIISRATQRLEQAERTRTAAPPVPTPPSDTSATGGRGRVLQVPDIVAFAAHVADILGLPPDLVNPLELRVVSTPTWQKKDGSLDPDPVFLSSPVIPDLERIKGAGRIGGALASYLSDPEVPERLINLRDDREAVLDGVRPAAFPPARWPSDASKPLTVSQQFAVNTILSELANGGLFSVNGPPGTGKTTLLRDLIAAIIVQRAAVLASLPTPEAAFTTARRWTAPDGKRRTVKAPRRELTGFEIVVASSNNNAVENITKELPALAAIGAEWQPAAKYFAEQATIFLDEPAWGMVAAPLGNAQKRKEFRERFWWGKRGMQALLKNVESDPPPVTEWETALRRFSEALKVTADLAAERTAADLALRFPVDAAEVRAAQDAADSAAEELRSAKEDCKHAARAVSELEHLVQALRAQSDTHEQCRPGGLRGLLGIGADVAAWRQRAQGLTTYMAHQNRQLWDTRQQADRLSRRVTTVRQRVSDTARNAESLVSRRADGEQRLQRARETWGPAFPEDWLQLRQDDQELTTPWSDEKWTTARAQVFVAALDLHRAFIKAAAGTIRRNLLQLVAALSREPGAPPPKAELAAWQTLFLLVPVISTTFASCGTMFAALTRESLGWVLVDEAGQAVPQHTAGALWRARRAVIVGDPMQLEPIFQVPGEIQDRMRILFGVDHHWLPAGTSAQGVADRRNRWGTTILTERRDEDTEQVWVGAPLRVHRRCEQPMFEISNAIAYHGLMVYGTREAPFPGGPHPEYPPSSWVDVTGPAEGKWVPTQGDALLGILRRMHVSNAVSLDRIYVLSPFRDVVRGCRSRVRTELVGDAVAEFAQNHIGTVHTMQGKETDVVVLVLGSDPSREKKARDWATRPANLLNVAVSRARRRLFVVGDLAEWRDTPNFRELACTLPHYPWRNAGGRLR